MKIRDKLGISKKMQETATRFMQIILVSIAALGVWIGSFKVFINAFISFLITFLPSLLRKRYKITIDAGLALWITSAVFFHSIGAVNLFGQNLYTSIPWWDHFTHALSASVIAAAGYSVLRALDEHYEQLYFPKKLYFVFIIIFIVAFGVIWEVLEFGIAGLADLAGGEPILTQYSLEDTMKDLMFNTAGALIVAVFGEAYLNNTVELLKQKIEELDGSEK
ncbi:hypothetical protein [Candidatus Nanohalobium constans]|uniref:DUF2238 domain-containing protein n=1 Tax=Candidatus Nanohalobium constans TaxID=2565781 RepID=A0A5Q0UFP5_9ARCH|nr:hypothetical protein [Candidatus Nanohalobium constans]QGA80443.1 hypothetical protein LC1Nh_0545 [Candidatus Nanohalobium constans]